MTTVILEEKVDEALQEVRLEGENLTEFSTTDSMSFLAQKVGAVEFFFKNNIF